MLITIKRSLWPWAIRFSNKWI